MGTKKLMTVLGNSSEFRARPSSHVYSGQQIDTVDKPMISTNKLFLPLLISELSGGFRGGKGGANAPPFGG